MQPPSPAVLRWLVVPLVVVALGAAGRRLPAVELRSVRRALDSPLAPLLAALVTAVALGLVWGSLEEPAFIHDEAAYLLQARIFASGHLAGPAPPLPEFFEQYHVLVTPRLAPKYPPGHALLLVPGIWLGWPGLGPVLLGGLSGGLVFALARRLAGGWVALLTWLVWLSAPALNIWRCTYLSESTSTAAFLLGGFALLRYQERRRTCDLVVLGLAVGWLAITRPVTALAIGAPLGLAALVVAGRGQAVRAAAVMAASGAAVLAILPAWDAASTGDWRTVPYTHYTNVYFPYEKLGFGVDDTPSQRELPPDMVLFDQAGRAIHRAHTARRLPRTLVERLRGAGWEMWGASYWRPPLVLFFALGLPFLDRRGWFAVACVVLLLAAHLAYAHPPQWAVYYHEVQPVLAFVTAGGIFRATGRSAFAAASVAVLVLGLGSLEALGTRRLVQDRVEYHRAFARTLATIRDPRAVVFVRYGPRHNPHRSLIQNPVDYERARIWVVRDRGADDARLLALAPERTAYVFDEASWTLRRRDAGSD